VQDKSWTPPVNAHLFTEASPDWHGRGRRPLGLAPSAAHARIKVSEKPHAEAASS